MMEIAEPRFLFCPFCGRGLGGRSEEGKTRQHCADCNWTYYPRVAASVTAMICGGGGDSVLLVRRLRDPFKGTWMFPSGFVDFGEHPEESLAREIREETSLTIRRADLIGVFQSPDDAREPGHFVFFYKVDVEPGEIRTDPQENEEIRWFDMHGQMPEVRWQLHKRFLAEMWGKQTEEL